MFLFSENVPILRVQSQAGHSRYEDGSILQSDASGDEISRKEARSDKRLHAPQQTWLANI